MKYLVTGCAGFIGWKVTEFLLEAGHTVVGVDNINTAYDTQVKTMETQTDRRYSKFLNFHRSDICDRDALRQIFSEV